MDDKYYQITILGCSRNQEDELTSFFFEHGALGLSENLNFEQKDPSNYAPTTIYTENFNLDIFFEIRPPQEFFQILEQRFTYESLKETEKENRDWLEEWKKGYEAFEIVKDIWVVPHWREAPPQAKKIIWMEPGMAFGTGTHETTQLVAQFMREIPIQSQESLLDVGTGSGLLSILAVHLGLEKVMANDIDPEALRVAQENLIKNNVEKSVEITTKQISEIDQQFDWVVANIIDGVLLNIKEDLLKCLKPSGHLILSGILDSRWPQFKQEFVEASGLKLLECKQKGEWVGVLLHA